MWVTYLLLVLQLILKPVVMKCTYSVLMETKVHFFGVIWIKISDPRSVWIMVRLKNRWIHSGHGFTGSLDASWSRQITDLDPDYLKAGTYPKCLKPRPNDRNMPTQHIATLLGATWSCVRLATLLRRVGCCWLKFDQFQTWANNS